MVLPAYFKCLAETEAASPEEFACAVDQVIADFAGSDGDVIWTRRIQSQLMLKVLLGGVSGPIRNWRK